MLMNYGPLPTRLVTHLDFSEYSHRENTIEYRCSCVQFHDFPISLFLWDLWLAFLARILKRPILTMPPKAANSEAERGESCQHL